MRSLLSLPTEIKHAILEEVIPAEKTPPADLASVEGERLPALPDSRSGMIQSERHPPIATAYGILGTNRELRMDAEAVLARLFSKGVKYKLDVLIVDVDHIIPTWLLTPVFSPHLATLDINIRIFDSDDNRWTASFTENGTDGMPRCAWTFNVLLGDFLRNGPCPPSGRHAGKRLGRLQNMSISSVNMNFTYCGISVQSLVTKGAVVAQVRRERGNSLDGEGPETDIHMPVLYFVAGRMASCLEALAIGRYSSVGIANVFQEQIGMFNTFVKGDLIKSCDINEMVRDRVLSYK